MKTIEITYKGIQYEIHYEKNGNDIIIVNVFYNGTDVERIFDSLDFEWNDFAQLIREGEQK